MESLCVFLFLWYSQETGRVWFLWYAQETGRVWFLWYSQETGRVWFLWYAQETGHDGICVCRRFLWYYHLDEKFNRRKFCKHGHAVFFLGGGHTHTQPCPGGPSARHGASVPSVANAAPNVQCPRATPNVRFPRATRATGGRDGVSCASTGRRRCWLTHKTFQRHFGTVYPQFNKMY